MCLSFSILLLMVSFWWSCRYGGCEGKLASHILLRQRLDPKEKQVINLDQDVQVCGYFWWMVDETPLYDFSLSLLIFFGMGYISLSFFSCLGGMWHTFFGYASFPLLFFDMPCGHVAYLLWVCIFFLYIPYILMITLERDSHGMSWSFSCGWMDGCTCYLPV